MKFLDYIKKYKFAIIAVICTAAILVGAFFAGEGLKEDSPAITGSATSDTISENYEKDLSQAVSQTTEEKENQNKSDDSVKTEKSTEAQTTTAADKTENKKPSKQNENAQVGTASSQISNPVQGNKDNYYTDEIPEGKPEPVEPQEQETQDTRLKCTFSISCKTVLDNMDSLDSSKRDIIPDDGWILKPVTVTFNEGESVFDVLSRVCREQKIHLEFSFTPMYNSAYIEGINNLYEFDCGSLSGWVYEVNNWFPNYGCSRYAVQNGDVIEFHYTCNLGQDVGGNINSGE